MPAISHMTTPDWMCRCGLSKEKEFHITSGNCPVYSDIREKYTDFENYKELVAYFDNVPKRRELLDAMEKDKQDFNEYAQCLRQNYAGPMWTRHSGVT